MAGIPDQDIDKLRELLSRGLFPATKSLTETIENLKNQNDRALQFDASRLSARKIMAEEEKAVFDLIGKLLEVGRSLDIYVILTLHIAASHNQSKRILNAATHFTYFKDSATHSNNYVLENYFGFDKKELYALKKINSRSITIIRDVPQLVLSGNLLCFQNRLTE